jgi:spermidine/putrescine transport system permease protein
MDEPWSRAKGVFATVAGPPVVWLTAFFLIPLAIIWAYSFGENESLTHIAVNGTFANYAHAVRPLYLGIIFKSFWFAALTTALCLVVGFPVAIAITFASEKTKAWLLLLIMLPFWTNLLIRTYALMAVLRTEGYVNFSLAFLWNGLGQVTALAGHPLAPFQPLELLHNNFAVVFGLVYVQLPFMVLPLYAALDRLDRPPGGEPRSRRRPHRHFRAGGSSARGARYRLGGAGHPDPLDRRLSDPRSPRRTLQPDDRQCDRAAVQDSQ